MTTRKPLVQINGNIAELPVGDTISGTPAGSQQVYVQATNPNVPDGTPAIWVQTGMGRDGTGFTLWFNT